MPRYSWCWEYLNRFFLGNCKKQFKIFWVIFFPPFAKENPPNSSQHWEYLGGFFLILLASSTSSSSFFSWCFLSSHLSLVTRRNPFKLTLVPRIAQWVFFPILPPLLLILLLFTTTKCGCSSLVPVHYTSEFTTSLLVPIH